METKAKCRASTRGGSKENEDLHSNLLEKRDPEYIRPNEESWIVVESPLSRGDEIVSEGVSAKNHVAER